MQKWGGQDKFLSALPRPPVGPYAVEKLIRREMTEKTLLQDALEIIFLIF
jgi:hypothetical protein